VDDDIAELVDGLCHPSQERGNAPLPRPVWVRLTEVEDRPLVITFIGHPRHDGSRLSRQGHCRVQAKGAVGSDATDGLATQPAAELLSMTLGGSAMLDCMTRGVGEEVVPFAVELRGGDLVISERLRA
jgi:hypothetical protein